MEITFDTEAFSNALEEKREQLNKATRPAAQAAAQVLYNQVKANVPVSEKGHWFYGTSFRKTGQRYWFDAGTLRDSIYQVFSQDNSTDTKATYHIAWNHKKAPYGFMVEIKKPFLGPAIVARTQDALDAMRERFIEETRT